MPELDRFEVSSGAEVPESSEIEQPVETTVSSRIMAPDQSDDVGGGVDRISGLPDDILRCILVGLPSTADAARTSVLSRRWRHVWAHLPELALRYGNRVDRLRAHELIDAAMGAYSAPTVRRLEIATPFGSRVVTAERASSWLRFASRRLAGRLKLSLPHPDLAPDKEGEILLPVCERVTAIDMEYVGRALRFQPLPAGGSAFAALATLRITDARVDGRELEHVLSSRCPRLKEVVLEWVSFSLRDGDDDAAAVLSIRSGSLQRLQMASGRELGGVLRVDTPELRVLTLRRISCNDAYIAAPKLSELYWFPLFYVPSRHRFAEAGRHLRRMEVTTGSPSMALMNRFNIVDELKVTLSVPQGARQYEKLLEDTNRLSKCEVLVLKFEAVKHDLKPIMVHLLQQCAGIRELVVEFPFKMGDYPCKLSRCPCKRLENTKTDRIVLHSLEEVRVKGGGEADHKAELVRMLCECHPAFKKKVSVSVRGGAHTRGKIRSFVPPDDRYDITVWE